MNIRQRHVPIVRSAARMLLLTALPVFPAMGVSIDELISLVRPDYQDVQAAGDEEFEIFRSLTSGTLRFEEYLSASRQFADSPNASRTMRAYGLATVASAYLSNHAPHRTVETLRTLIQEFAEVQEVALVAELVIVELMADQGGTNPQFNPSLIEHETQLQRVLNLGSPYDHRIAEERIAFALDCGHAVRSHALMMGYEQVAVEHFEALVRLAKELAENPVLAGQDIRSDLFAHYAERAERELNKIAQAQEMPEREGIDPYAQALYGATDDAAPSLAAEAMAAYIERDSLLGDKVVAEAAVTASPRALAVLAHYLRPEIGGVTLQNAARIAAKVPNGFVTSWLMDHLLSPQSEWPQSEREAVASVLDARDFVEKMVYYGGREKWFGQIFGPDAIAVLLSLLDTSAPERAQRNAAVFLMGYSGGPIAVPLMAYLHEPRSEIGLDLFAAYQRACLALAATNDSAGLDFLAKMATDDYWASRPDRPVYIDYRSENDAEAKTRRFLRYQAFGALQSVKTTEARERVKHLRDGPARDLLK